VKCPSAAARRKGAGEAVFMRVSPDGAETAKALKLGVETVRSHLKKAQEKLGVRNRTQAVAEALRQHLIP
jgi:hypothetical protein